MRKSPFTYCRRHARETAATGGGPDRCPYRAKVWVTVWLRELQRVQQADIEHVLHRRIFRVGGAA